MDDDPVLRVEDLTIEFLSDRTPFRAVEKFALTLRRGETLAILGESGSGKSVSTSAIMDLLDIPPARIVSGRAVFAGRDLLAMDAEDRRKLNGPGIAIVFQDPQAHLNPVHPVGRQIMEVFEVHGRARGDDARGRTVALLERVGIPDAARRFEDYPHQFSGGQRQRIMIAMAVALEPEIIIADEPTTALDVSIQAQILDLLRDLQRELGMGLILITHDLGVAAAMADEVIVMRRGRIVEAGPARTVFETPRSDYTRTLLKALPEDSGHAARPGRETALPVLEVRNLFKTYGGAGRNDRGVQALRDVSFDLRSGETLGIVGESGSGKSTIARILMRLDPSTGGSVIYKGQDITALSGRALTEFRRRVQMVFQDPYSSLNPRMTVQQIVQEPLAIHRSILPRDRWRERVEELLTLVGMDPGCTDRHPHQFSGGQRQRIAIARALAGDPDVIVCDEAVSALDVTVQAQIIDLLSDLRDRMDLSYVFITHDLPVVRHFADRIMVMKDGEVVETGRTAQIFDAPGTPYTKALLASRPEPKWALAGARGP